MKIKESIITAKYAVEGREDNTFIEIPSNYPKQRKNDLTPKTDNSGRIIELKSKTDDGDKIQYEYDESGNIVKWKYFNNPNDIKPNETEEFKFNDQNEVKRRIVKKENSVWNFNYVYEKRDRFGNWTKRVVFDVKKETLYKTEKREIIYN